MKRTYIQPASEAMDFSLESTILANSINVHADKTTDKMFSNKKEFSKNIWDSEEE